MLDRSKAAALVVCAAATLGWLACSSGDGAGAPAPPEPAADAAPPPVTTAEDASPAVDAAPPPVDDCGTQIVDALPHRLGCVGLYTDIAAKAVSPDYAAYTPGVELWSDGAEKHRWVSLPTGGTVDATNPDEWTFPAGTTLAKEFAVAGKRIETRIFRKDDKGWHHASYRWNDAETEADRIDLGATVPLPNRTPYEIPKSADCIYCHAGRKEPVLGFEPVSLGLPAAKGLTLAALVAAGRISPTPSKTALTIPDDGTGKLAAAAGWLHANCGHCHNEATTAGAYGARLKLLVKTSELAPPDAGVASSANLAVVRTGVCLPSERFDDTAGTNFLYVRGGDPAKSLASLLSGSRAAPGQENIVNQMPPILTHMVDATGHAAFDAWISALPPCP